MNALRNFISFSRPHTITGTSLSIICLWAISLSLDPEHGPGLALLLSCLFSCLAANVYIVGLNQLTDIGIDRINKPELPLASGAYTPRTGMLIILSGLVLSLLVAYQQGTYLFAAVGLSVVLGTLYSLPPVRLKRFPFWAAFCIIAVRGLIVNVFLFLHFKTGLGGTATLPALVWALTGLMFVYGLVIAWFKDMPDLEGDRVYRINTFSLRWGVGRVFYWGNILLAVACGTVIAIAAGGWLEGNAAILISAHLALIWVLRLASSRVDQSDRRSLTRFYQFVWKLFFSEYIIFALAALIS